MLDITNIPAKEGDIIKELPINRHLTTGEEVFYRGVKTQYIL